MRVGNVQLSGRLNLAAAITRVADPTGLAPYFGACLRGLVRREMPAEMVEALRAAGMTPTLAVTEDGILYWSEEFARNCETEELALGLMHEAMHLLFKHHERARAISVTVDQRMIANVAQDACINEDIRKMGRQAPKGWIYPETLQQPPGLIFEERFRLLKQMPPKRSKSGTGSGHCGGCAGNPVPGEPTAGGKEGRSAAEMERIRKETAASIQDHAAKHPGTLPGSLERWAAEVLAPPKVDWRTKLASTVRAAIAYRPGAVDFDWTRPSRRQAGVGFGAGRPIMPAYRAPVPRVGVLIDTSGSMSEAALTTALGELRGILAAAGAQVTVAVCDADVHGIREISTINDAVALLKGGGGTDMTPGLYAMAERAPQPEIVVVVTDGYIPEVRYEPPFGVLWAIVGENAGFAAPFGEAIYIDDIEAEAA